MNSCLSSVDIWYGYIHCPSGSKNLAKSATERFPVGTRTADPRYHKNSKCPRRVCLRNTRGIARTNSLATPARSVPKQPRSKFTTNTVTNTVTTPNLGPPRTISTRCPPSLAVLPLSPQPSQPKPRPTNLPPPPPPCAPPTPTPPTSRPRPSGRGPATKNPSGTASKPTPKAASSPRPRCTTSRRPTPSAPSASTPNSASPGSAAPSRGPSTATAPASPSSAAT